MNKLLYFKVYNKDEEVFRIGDNIFSIHSNNLYLNDSMISSINNKNVIDLVGKDNSLVYLNGEDIKDIDTLIGDFIINTRNIKYVKTYNKLLNGNNINNNYNKNRSWLDEE